MYFFIDAIIIIMLTVLIIVSVKKGFSGNFLFDILHTILGIAGGAGLCFGAYLLMDKFGWLEYMADGVVKFFGKVENPNELINDANFLTVAKIIAYVPFGILFLVVGYIVAHKLIGWIFKGLFAPVFIGRKKSKTVRIIDNVLGIILNVGIFVGVVLSVFGFVHATSVNDKYKNMAGAEDLENQKVGEQLINDFCEPLLTTLHENFSASPIGGFIYRVNPLNKAFEDLLK